MPESPTPAPPESLPREAAVPAPGGPARTQDDGLFVNPLEWPDEVQLFHCGRVETTALSGRPATLAARQTGTKLRILGFEPTGSISPQSVFWRRVAAALPAADAGGHSEKRWGIACPLPGGLFLSESLRRDELSAERDLDALRKTGNRYDARVVRVLVTVLPADGEPGAAGVDADDLNPGNIGDPAREAINATEFGARVALSFNASSVRSTRAIGRIAEQAAIPLFARLAAAELLIPCTCWREAMNRYRHRRDPAGACSCAAHPEAERCDCPYCTAVALAAQLPGAVASIREAIEAAEAASANEGKTAVAHADAVARLAAAEREREKLLNAIKTHHDQKADDRCIEDDDRLYAAAGLPPCDRRVGDKAAMLRNCQRFIERRCEGGGWPTYRELEAEVERLKNPSKEA